MKKALVLLCCFALLTLSACASVTKEDYAALQSELQHVEEVQSGILAVLNMTEEEVIGYKNGTWSFPESVVEPAAEAPEAAPAEEDAAVPAPEAAPAADSEAAAEGQAVTVALTVDNFAEYFAFALTPEYDVFGEQQSEKSGMLRLRSINPQYKGWLPVVSDDFAVKAIIRKQETITQGNSITGISGKLGLQESRVENVIGSVTFYPASMYDFEIRNLKTSNPDYECYIRQGGADRQAWNLYCIDLEYFAEENDL